MDRVKIEIKKAAIYFNMAKTKFEKEFHRNAKLCKYRKQVVCGWKVDGKHPLGWKCMLKYEPHAWGCDSGNCPYIRKGLRLATGGVS